TAVRGPARRRSAGHAHAPRNGAGRRRSVAGRHSGGRLHSDGRRSERRLHHLVRGRLSAEGRRDVLIQDRRIPDGRLRRVGGRMRNIGRRDFLKAAPAVTGAMAFAANAKGAAAEQAATRTDKTSRISDTTYAAADYPIQAIPYFDVTVTDTFWRRKI